MHENKLRTFHKMAKIELKAACQQQVGIGSNVLRITGKKSTLTKLCLCNVHKKCSILNGEENEVLRRHIRQYANENYR